MVGWCGWWDRSRAGIVGHGALCASRGGGMVHGVSQGGAQAPTGGCLSLLYAERKGFVIGADLDDRLHCVGHRRKL
jgi:hypothetical protein